jgi:ABC-type multidrug transport system ATPase subunit
MHLKAEDLSKKFKNEWIFKEFTYQFVPDTIYAVRGPNGSGKSTLLQVLSGFVPANYGNLQFYDSNNTPITLEQSSLKIAFASPFLELIEEFSIIEMYNFQSKFKTFTMPITQFTHWLGLEKHKNKPLKQFSSGMRQKVKIGLAFASDASLLFLDEPTTNLDTSTKLWYQDQLQTQTNKTIIIASNDPEEYKLATKIIDIYDYKV